MMIDLSPDVACLCTVLDALSAPPLYRLLDDREDELLRQLADALMDLDRTAALGRALAVIATGDHPGDPEHCWAFRAGYHFDDLGAPSRAFWDRQGGRDASNRELPSIFHGGAALPAPVYDAVASRAGAVTERRRSAARLDVFEGKRDQLLFSSRSQAYLSLAHVVAETMRD